MWLARLCLTDENGCHLDEVWAMDEAWAASAGTQHLSLMLVSATHASSAPPQTSHRSWMGVEGLMHTTMMNLVIALNENRTLTKPHLLLVTLLNVKSNNQPQVFKIK